MKEENKVLMANEIVLNFKLTIYGCIIALVITSIYGEYIYPPKTYYTPPEKLLFAGEVLNIEWPDSEDGDAVFVPYDAINLGIHWSAYFSNESKYDEIAFMRCVGKTRNYPYPESPKISDVIEAINETRIKCYKKDLVNFFVKTILYSILFYQ